MISAASSTEVSGLADCGSGVIQSATRAVRRSSPEAAERSTSRSVRIPARNRPCITMAEPTFALTIPAGASATGVSGGVSHTLEPIRSRGITRGSRLAGSVTAAHLVEFAVKMRGGRPGQFLRQHPPQRTGPRGQIGPFLPEELQSGLVELDMGLIRRDSVPHVLEAVNRVEEDRKSTRLNSSHVEIS